MMQPEHFLIATLLIFSSVFLVLLMRATGSINKGEVLYTWKYSWKEEFRVNPFIFYVIPAFLVINLWRIYNLPADDSGAFSGLNRLWFEIVFILLLLILVVYFLRDRKVELTTKGISFRGIFIYWSQFEGYRIDRDKKALILKFKGRWNGSFKYPVEEPEVVERFISGYLKKIG